MPYLVSKTFAGCDYTLADGKKISVNGGCALNEISAADFAALKKQYPIVDELLQKGVYVYGESQEASAKAAKKGVDEVKQETADKQEAAQKANAAKTNIKVKAEK